MTKLIQQRESFDVTPIKNAFIHCREHGELDGKLAMKFFSLQNAMKMIV